MSGARSLLLGIGQKRESRSVCRLVELRQARRRTRLPRGAQSGLIVALSSLSSSVWAGLRGTEMEDERELERELLVVVAGLGGAAPSGRLGVMRSLDEAGERLGGRCELRERGSPDAMRTRERKWTRGECREGVVGDSPAAAAVAVGAVLVVGENGGDELWSGSGTVTATGRVSIWRRRFWKSAVEFLVLSRSPSPSPLGETTETDMVVEDGSKRVGRSGADKKTYWSRSSSVQSQAEAQVPELDTEQIRAGAEQVRSAGAVQRTQSHLGTNQRLLLSCFKSPIGRTSILPLPSRASTPSSPVSRS